MSNVVTLSVGVFEENCYLVQLTANGTVFIIDPGYEPERIAAEVKKLDIQQCYLNSLDRQMFESPNNSYLPFYPVRNKHIATSSTVDYSEFEIILMPGHSKGGVAFYFKELNALFCGDSIFASSIGRTDIPGGNYETLIKSIKQNILTLPETTILYPGHGGTTSVGREKAVNPYLKGC